MLLPTRKLYMKIFFTALALTLLFLAISVGCSTGCGYSHVDNEVIGQPKAVESTTPLLCPNQHILHLSLGVMRHGVGSMSTEDIRINVPDGRLVAGLDKAVRTGKIISAVTNEARIRWCNEPKELVSFKVLEDDPETPTAPAAPAASAAQ